MGGRRSPLTYFSSPLAEGASNALPSVQTREEGNLINTHLYPAPTCAPCRKATDGRRSTHPFISSGEAMNAFPHPRPPAWSTAREKGRSTHTCAPSLLRERIHQFFSISSPLSPMAYSHEKGESTHVRHLSAPPEGATNTFIAYTHTHSHTHAHTHTDPYM